MRAQHQQAYHPEQQVGEDLDDACA